MVYLFIKKIQTVWNCSVQVIFRTFFRDTDDLFGVLGEAPNYPQYNFLNVDSQVMTMTRAAQVFS